MKRISRMSKNNYSNFIPLNNRHIIRFPLESLLTNILNIPCIGTNSNGYNNELNIGDLYLCSSIDIPILNENHYYIAIYIDFIL